MFLVTNHMCIYRHIYSSLANSLSTINFFKVVCTLLFCVAKKTTTILCLNQSWTSIDFFLFLYSELDAKAEEQCADSIEEIDRFSRGFPTSAQHFQNAMEIKTNQWRSMSGWPISTQSHLMDIMQVCMFCWFSHGLGTLPESYLKPWEEIHHSQDLKI